MAYFANTNKKERRIQYFSKMSVAKNITVIWDVTEAHKIYKTTSFKRTQKKL